MNNDTTCDICLKKLTLERGKKDYIVITDPNVLVRVTIHKNKQCISDYFMRELNEV